MVRRCLLGPSEAGCWSLFFKIVEKNVQNKYKLIDPPLPDASSLLSLPPTFFSIVLKIIHDSSKRLTVCFHVDTLETCNTNYKAQNTLINGLQK